MSPDWCLKRPRQVTSVTTVLAPGRNTDAYRSPGSHRPALLPNSHDKRSRYLRRSTLGSHPLPGCSLVRHGPPAGRLLLQLGASCRPRRPADGLPHDRDPKGRPRLSQEGIHVGIGLRCRYGRPDCRPHRPDGSPDLCPGSGPLGNCRIRGDDSGNHGQRQNHPGCQGGARQGPSDRLSWRRRDGVLGGRPCPRRAHARLHPLCADHRC